MEGVDLPPVLEDFLFRFGKIDAHFGWSGLDVPEIAFVSQRVAKSAVVAAPRTAQ
jgi:hypothetical protein